MEVINIKCLITVEIYLCHCDGFTLSLVKSSYFTEVKIILFKILLKYLYFMKAINKVWRMALRGIYHISDFITMHLLYTLWDHHTAHRSKLVCWKFHCSIFIFMEAVNKIWMMAVQWNLRHMALLTSLWGFYFPYNLRNHHISHKSKLTGWEFYKNIFVGAKIINEKTFVLEWDTKYF